jgi:hypothetical protein
MSHPRMLRTALSCLCLVSCSATTPAPPPAPKCPPAPTPAATSALAPAPEPPAAEPAKAFEPPPAPDPAWSLSPTDVVLQLEYEPTLAVVVASNPTKPFGRIPTFTLYRDGTIIFEEERGGGSRGTLLTHRLSENEAAYHLEHVQKLGFAQIRSHTSSCLPTPQGDMCLSDSSYLLLRAKTPGGPRREIRNYAGWEPRHQAQLHAIYDRIKVLSAEGRTARDVRPYLPPKATLFLSRPYAPDALEPRFLAAAHPWPLPAALLDQAGAEGPSFVAIDAAQVRALFAAAGENVVQNEWFRQGERLVQATVVPWLPGVDHTAAIEQAKREKK